MTVVPNSVSIHLDRLSAIDVQRDSNLTMTESALTSTSVRLEFTTVGTTHGLRHSLTSQFVKIQKVLIRVTVTQV